MKRSTAALKTYISESKERAQSVISIKIILHGIITLISSMIKLLTNNDYSQHPTITSLVLFHAIVSFFKFRYNWFDLLDVISYKVELLSDVPEEIATVVFRCCCILLFLFRTNKISPVVYHGIISLIPQKVLGITWRSSISNQIMHFIIN